MRQALLLFLLLPALLHAEALEEARKEHEMLDGEEAKARPKPRPDETAEEKRMREELSIWVGRSMDTVFQVFGTPSDGFPNGRYFQVLWENGKTRDACRFWFDVDETRTVRDWYWSGKCPQSVTDEALARQP